MPSIYNADGTIRVPEFQVNTASSNSQYAPNSPPCPDGTFVVAWQSNENGANRYDIYANRYDNSGHVLDEQFRVNSGISGDKFSIALTPVQGGFVAAWQSQPAGGESGGDGSADGISRHVSWSTAGRREVMLAATPTLTVQNAAGNQDTAIPLSIGAVLNDPTPGTPETLRLEIAGIPAGAVLADGVGGHTSTATAALTAVDVASWNLAHLTITPPAGSTAAINLTVRATATEPGGDIASVAALAHVTVNAVTPPQQPYNVEFVLDPATGLTAEAPQLASFANGDFVATWRTASPAATRTTWSRGSTTPTAPRKGRRFSSTTPPTRARPAAITTTASRPRPCSPTARS